MFSRILPEAEIRYDVTPIYIQQMYILNSFLLHAIA